MFEISLCFLAFHVQILIVQFVTKSKYNWAFFVIDSTVNIVYREIQRRVLVPFVNILLYSISVVKSNDMGRFW